jgi:hypothetical protein
LKAIPALACSILFASIFPIFIALSISVLGGGAVTLSISLL